MHKHSKICSKKKKMYESLTDEDLFTYLDERTKINDSSVIRQFRSRIMKNLDKKSSGIVRSIIASGNILDLV